MNLRFNRFMKIADIQRFIFTVCVGVGVLNAHQERRYVIKFLREGNCKWNAAPAADENGILAVALSQGFFCDPEHWMVNAGIPGTHTGIAVK